MHALLAYTDDAQLSKHSGYHTIADFLPECPRIVLPRLDPTAFFPRLQARIQRRFSFSRWCVGGSFEMETQIKDRIAQGYKGPVHYLWCDRDLGFLDKQLNLQANPLIGTFHECVDTLPKVVRRVNSLPRFAAIIIMSETQRPWFAACGVDLDRVHRIPHGVDTGYFKPSSIELAEHFTVLSVGGTRRNFSLLHDVASSLKNEPCIRFEVVGPNDKKEMFGALPNLQYHDRLTDAELLHKYQSASCLLHLVENSTANNVMNEALACGVPVISERHGGVPEYVTTECAELSPPGDGLAVVQSIKKLAADRQKREDMKLAARNHACSLDWKITAQQTRALYQAVA